MSKKRLVCLLLIHIQLFKKKRKNTKKIANFIHQDEPENFAYTVEEHYEAIFLKSFDLALVFTFLWG